MTPDKTNRINRWRLAGWTAAAVVLLIPLVAMQFTDEVDWDAADFAIMGTLFAAVGLGFELATKKARTAGYRTAYKAGVGLALLAGFLLIWVNGAVGIIGNEGNVANRMYDGVLAVGLLGALVARLEPRGMVIAMYAAAAAQALAFVVALAVGWGYTGPITVFFCALWLGSAALFREAEKNAAAASSDG